MLTSQSLNHYHLHFLCLFFYLCDLVVMSGAIHLKGAASSPNVVLHQAWSTAGRVGPNCWKCSSKVWLNDKIVLSLLCDILKNYGKDPYFGHIHNLPLCCFLTVPCQSIHLLVIYSLFLGGTLMQTDPCSLVPTNMGMKITLLCEMTPP